MDVEVASNTFIFIFNITILFHYIMGPYYFGGFIWKLFPKKREVVSLLPAQFIRQGKKTAHLWLYLPFVTPT